MKNTPHLTYSHPDVLKSIQLFYNTCGLSLIDTYPVKKYDVVNRNKYIEVMVAIPILEAMQRAVIRIRKVLYQLREQGKNAPIQSLSTEMNEDSNDENSDIRVSTPDTTLGVKDLFE